MERRSHRHRCGHASVRAVAGARTRLLLLPRPLEELHPARPGRGPAARAGRRRARARPRVPYGALGRLPDGPAAIARAPGAAPRGCAARARCAPSSIFHPFQWPLARALLERAPGRELWYGRWDRYEAAYDADAARRAAGSRRCTPPAAARADLDVRRLRRARRARARGRPRAPRSCPTSRRLLPGARPRRGRRRRLARPPRLAHRLGAAARGRRAACRELVVLLLVGEVARGRVRGDADFEACRGRPSFVWLGRRSDEEAARLILVRGRRHRAVPPEPFNDAGLPYRILKYARLGRRTVAPPLAGVRTWERAVTRPTAPQAFAAALRAARGARPRPDPSCARGRSRRPPARRTRRWWGSALGGARDRLQRCRGSATPRGCCCVDESRPRAAVPVRSGPRRAASFWAPPGGGVEEGEDVAARRPPCASSPRRRPARRRARAGDPAPAPPLTWRGADYDQRERWFLARAAHFEPDGAGRTPAGARGPDRGRAGWTVAELAAHARRAACRRDPRAARAGTARRRAAARARHGRRLGRAARVGREALVARDRHEARVGQVRARSRRPARSRSAAASSASRANTATP